MLIIIKETYFNVWFKFFFNLFFRFDFGFNSWFIFLIFKRNIAFCIRNVAWWKTLGGLIKWRRNKRRRIYTRWRTNSYWYRRFYIWWRTFDIISDLLTTHIIWIMWYVTYLMVRDRGWCVLRWPADCLRSGLNWNVRTDPSTALTKPWFEFDQFIFQCSNLLL